MAKAFLRAVIVSRRGRADAGQITPCAASSGEVVSPFYVALVVGGLRQNDQALDWLEKAYQDRSNGLIFLKVDPEPDSLRSNPRFQFLQRRVALPL